MSHKSIIGCLIVLAALSATPARGHVALLAPNGGETLTSGSFYTVTWEILVGHPMLGWDLWYSTESRQGPWTEIALNIAPGDTALGSIHYYDWVVPQSEAAGNVWVRVRQNTTPGQHKWEDTSAASFSIGGDCCDGTRGNVDGDPFDRVDIADLVTLVSWMFKGGTSPACAYEANIDGLGAAYPDISDLVYLVNYMFKQGPEPASCG